MQSSLSDILKILVNNPLADIHFYKGIITNGHFVVNASVIPDSVKRKLYVSRKNRVPAHVLENVRNMLLTARKKDLHKEKVIEFVSSRISNDVVYMDLDDRTIAYLLLYYEFFTLLEFSIFHDVDKNYGYIVKKGSSKVVGLLMPVMVPEVRNRK